MTLSASTATPRTYDLGAGLTLSVAEYGDPAARGSAVLVLHGGGGPRTVAGLAAALSERAHVIAPTHPGFEGTYRPEWLTGIDDLAVAYLDLLDALDLTRVLVIGSSIGGWIAAEMALRDTNHRVRGLVLINAVGIQVHGPDDVVDIRNLSPAELGTLAFHNPALRPDPSTFTDDQRAVALANQRTLAIYGGALFTQDPKLRRRLRRVRVPVLVVWGEQDGIAPLDYGRAYADAFPRGRFVPIAKAGHLPQIEQPGRTLAAIDEFTDTDLIRWSRQPA